MNEATYSWGDVFPFTFMAVLALFCWVLVYWSWHPERIPAIQRDQRMFMGLMQTGWALPVALCLNSGVAFVGAQILRQVWPNRFTEFLFVATGLFFAIGLVSWIAVFFTGHPQFLVAPAYRGHGLIDWWRRRRDQKVQ